MGTSVNSPFSSSELKVAVLRLISEKVLSSRKKILKQICCGASVSSEDLRTVGEALTTCLIEAANGPAKKSQGLPEVFILYAELAVKITAADVQEGLSHRDLPEVPKMEQAVMRLTSTVFESVAEVYLAGPTPLLEEPFASTLERLTSNAFELVRLLYVCMMKRPSSQPADDEMLRKRCQELLTVIYRLVHIFRKQVFNGIIGTTDNSRQENSPGSRWPTALRIVASSIQSFTELGKLSSSCGEKYIVLLNMSWKSILTLLQVDEGRDAVASVVDISSIVVTLISNSVQATKRAIETWIVKSSDPEQKEVRRLCIAIKFFLLIALKISSVYPLKAVMPNGKIIACASKVFACLFQKDIISHKAATEAFAEFVVPSAFALLQNLLNDRHLSDDLKIQILRNITMDSNELEISQTITDLNGCNKGNDIVDELFWNKPSLRPGAGLLRTGRVVLFLSFLRASCKYSKALLYELLAKLPWLLDEVQEEGMYMLMTQTLYLPVDSSDMSGKWKWQVMFPWVSHAIEVFAVVTAKHESIWIEFKYFLFNEVLHPSVICGELMLSVWSFIVRQSDPEMARDYADSLLSILRRLVLVEEEETLQRRLARAICVLLQAAADPVPSLFCNTNPFRSDADAYIITQLLQEGLPLSKPGTDILLSYCINCGKGLVESLKLESRGLNSNLYIPKQALICLPLLLSQSACRGDCIKEKNLEEIKQIVLNLISVYTIDHKNSRMFHNRGIIGPTLELIPHVLHVLDPANFQVLLPRLLEICLTTPESSEGIELKQSLPEFLANLSEVAIPEDESNTAMKALWGLYHLVLREKKSWALIHMGLKSFEYFAARTSCEQLWRFVPPDAAVVSNGDGAGDFMAALKVFIEKECALLSLASSGEELQLLRAESNSQQQKHEQILAPLRKQKDKADLHIHQSTKPDIKPTSGNSEIQEAFAMLCKGIGVLKERAPEVLNGEASQDWEALRARLAEMNEQVKAFQRRDG